MRLINYNKAIIFFSITAIMSCEDIFVADIASSEVTLVAPADSADTYETMQMFLWEQVKGATEYNITLFSPDLATAGSVILDSVVVEPSFKVSLAPGAYEWCVKASNGFYTTRIACNKLVIKEGVGAKQVQLIAPADDSESSNAEQIFWWEPVSGAMEYTLIVVSPDLLTPNRVLLDTIIKKNLFIKELLIGEYEWCVKAGDGRTTTDMFCRTLKIVED
jgi:hypothetical protein